MRESDSSFPYDMYHFFLHIPSKWYSQGKSKEFSKVYRWASNCDNLELSFSLLPSDTILDVILFLFSPFQVITFVHKDISVVKTQSAGTGTQELLVNARAVMSLSKEIQLIVKVNNLLSKVS